MSDSEDVTDEFNELGEEVHGNVYIRDVDKMPYPYKMKLTFTFEENGVTVSFEGDCTTSDWIKVYNIVRDLVLKTLTISLKRMMT